MVFTPTFWNGEFVIKKPWKDVMRAAQVKYPNPFNSNLLSIDIISRHIDQRTGVLYSTKLINSSWPMFPKAGELRAVERSEIDPQKQYMLLESHNIDLRGVLRAQEKLEYVVHPENIEWTLVRHQISVEAFRFIAYAAISASQNTARSGREALKWVIDNRVDYFMERVPTRAQFEPGITSQSSQEIINTRSPWNRLRSLWFPLLQPITNHTYVDRLSPISSWFPWRQHSCSSSIPSSLERAIMSFDSFHPIETLEGIRDRVATDVSVLREQLRRRCQRVINRFSKVDEYVLIM